MDESVSLELMGLIMNFIGSIFFVFDPIKIIVKEEHIWVKPDEKWFRLVTWLHYLGIALLPLGFLFQFIGLWQRT